MTSENKEVHERKLKGGKFLTFQLHGEEYGLEIIKVREIIGVMEITSVPQTPMHVKGVINLRGMVVPVVDLRLKFGFEEAEYNSETCIIVVDVKGVLMGMIVDTVSEVMDIEGENIEPAPSFGDEVNTDFILGMGKVNEKVKTLLDIDRVLSGEDMVISDGMAGGDWQEGEESLPDVSLEEGKSQQEESTV